VYTLATGSLLGAYRHGALIPYDYDLDVYVSLPLTADAGKSVCMKSLTQQRRVVWLIPLIRLEHARWFCGKWNSCATFASILFSLLLVAYISNSTCSSYPPEYTLLGLMQHIKDEYQCDEARNGAQKSLQTVCGKTIHVCVTHYRVARASLPTAVFWDYFFP
jgi:hypothetical protein